jgi:hypothetical protein
MANIRSTKMLIIAPFSAKLDICRYCKRLQRTFKICDPFPQEGDRGVSVIHSLVVDASLARTSALDAMAGAARHRTHVVLPFVFA